MAEKATRKLKAKRFNEHVRMFATSINALGLVVIGAGFVQPIITGGMADAGARLSSWIWIVIGIALHLTAQASLRLLRDEDADE